MNTNIKKIILITAIVIMVFANITTVFAANDDYVAVSGISQIEEVADSADLEGMVGLFFSYAIGVAVILAVFFIIYGAILYMTTDAFSQKSEGKEKIISAIGGLILALISWLILYQINPELVNVSFDTKMSEEEIEEMYNVQIDHHEGGGYGITGSW